MLKLPDGTVKVLVEGEQRGEIERFIEVDGHCRAEVQLIDEVDAAERESEVFTRSLLSQFEQYVQLGKKVPAEVLASLNGIDEPSRLVDTMAAHMVLKIEQKQEILEITDLAARVEHVLALLDAEIDLLQVEKRIRGRVKKQMERSQREYYLNEQMKAIQKELGDSEEGHNELDELRKRIDNAGLTAEALTKPMRSSTSSSRCRRCPLRPLWCAPTLTGWSMCHGKRRARYVSIWHALKAFWMRITMVWKRSRSASLSISPCRSALRNSKARYCVWSDHLVWVKPHWPSRLPVPQTVSSCVWRSVVCVMKLKSVVIAAPILAPCRVD